VGIIDDLRERPLATIDGMVAAHRERGERAPVSVGVLRWMFLTGRPSRMFRRLATRVVQS
jgi:hypothetical protein